MNMKNTVAVVGGILLLILVGVVLMHRGKGGGGIEKEPRDAPVSTIQTDAQHFNVVTNLKAPTSIPEEIPAAVESVDLQSSVEPDESSNSNQINIAGKNYPVLFEGQGVSSELKRTIIGDLALNLSHFQRIDFMELPPAEEEPAAQMYQQKITHWLDEGKQHRFFSGTVEKYFGGAVRVGDTFQLVIHEKLVEEYKQAVAFREAHVRMFEKLDEFVRLLSDNKAIHSLAEGDVGVIRNLMYFHEIPEPVSDEEYKRGIRLWNVWVRPPSLLDVKTLGSFGRQDIASEDVYVFSTLISNAARDPEYLMKKPMGVFIDGEWRILIMQGP